MKVCNDKEAKLILYIPIGEFADRDDWAWTEEKSGVYSVRSVYKRLLLEKREWNRSHKDSIWSSI